LQQIAARESIGHRLQHYRRPCFWAAGVYRGWAHGGRGSPNFF